MSFIAMLLNLLCFGFAGLNGWLLFGHGGGPLNAVALVMCLGSGIYGLMVAAR